MVKIRHGGVSYTALDNRYYTKAQLNSTTAPSGASLIGIADAGGYFVSTNLEAALQELMDAILPGAYLRLDGTNVPTANYNWITNLTTTGTLQGGTLTDGTATLTGGAWTGATYNGLTVTTGVNTFTLTSGTTDLTVSADCTIDQNLSTASSPTFNFLTVTKLVVNEDMLELYSGSQIRFWIDEGITNVGAISCDSTDGKYSFGYSDYHGELDFSGLTDVRSFAFPDVSGTLALTSDFGVLETDPVAMAYLNQAVKTTSNVTFGTLGAKGYTSNLVAKIGAYTLTASDDIVTASGTFTLTLPTASGITGKIYFIKNVGTGIITIDGNGAETIDGSATYVIRNTYEAVTIISNGTNWSIL